MKQIFIDGKATTMFIPKDLNISTFIKYVRKRMVEPDNIYGLERPNDCKASVVWGKYYDSIKIESSTEETIITFEDVVPIRVKTTINEQLAMNVAESVIKAFKKDENTRMVEYDDWIKIVELENDCVSLFRKSNQIN